MRGPATYHGHGRLRKLIISNNVVFFLKSKIIQKENKASGVIKMCKEKNGLPARKAFLYNKVIRDIYILITEKKFVVKNLYQIFPK